MTYNPQTFALVNVITVVLAMMPWGMIPYGNIPLQRIGLTVQITGLVCMFANFALLIFLR